MADAPIAPKKGIKKAQPWTRLRADIIRLILRKDRVTAVRDAVVLVPPTALILYLVLRKK